MIARPPLLLASILLGIAGGCRGADAELPLTGDLELCCKAALDDEISFVGCRAAGLCQPSEEVWVRGPLTCTADDPEICEGGRCCQLDLEALAVRGAGPERARPPEATDEELDAAIEPAVAAPEPAPVTPVPLDWSARPTPVVIPKLVCPATVERGVSGEVVLWLVIDASGRVTEAAIRESLEPECDALARDALLHAEFEPGLDPEGQPVATELRWRYLFSAPTTP